MNANNINIIIGNNIAFAICANWIIRINLIPVLEIIVPIIKIIIQIDLNFNDLRSALHPKQPHATNDAAKGAVIALVKPAEIIPNDIKNLEKLP